MSQLKNVGPEEFESPEAYVAFGRLCRELEVFAGQLNPDYIQGPHGYALEDGSHGCATSEDIGGRLLTEVIFEAHRFRGHGYDEKTGIAFPAAPAGAEYRLLSSIRYIVDGLLDFPDDVREAMRADQEFQGILEDPDSGFSIELTQEYTLVTNGLYRRECVLRFNAGDESLFNDFAEDTDFGLPKPSQAEATAGASDDLRALFGDDVSGFLSELDSKMGKKPMQLFYDNLSAIRGISATKEYGLIRGLVSQIPVRGISAADAAADAA